MTETGNQTIDKIAANHRFVLFKISIRKLRKLERQNYLPPNILVAIFLIETSCRPFLHRIAEYVLLTIGIFLSGKRKRPVKNYTIGRCQLGLTYIFNYSKKRFYDHLDYIPNLTPKDFFFIIRTLLSKGYYNIFARRVYELYKKGLRIYGENKINLVYRYVGEQYNGTYSYGLLLSALIRRLND